MRPAPTQIEALSALDMALGPITTHTINTAQECQACLELAEYGVSLAIPDGAASRQTVAPEAMQEHLRTAVATRAFPPIPWAQLVGTLLQLVGGFLAGTPAVK